MSSKIFFDNSNLNPARSNHTLWWDWTWSGASGAGLSNPLEPNELYTISFDSSYPVNTTLSQYTSGKVELQEINLANRKLSYDQGLGHTSDPSVEVAIDHIQHQTYP